MLKLFISTCIIHVDMKQIKNTLFNFFNAIAKIIEFIFYKFTIICKYKFLHLFIFYLIIKLLFNFLLFKCIFQKDKITALNSRNIFFWFQKISNADIFIFLCQGDFSSLKDIFFQYYLNRRHIFGSFIILAKKDKNKIFFYYIFFSAESCDWQ